MWGALSLAGCLLLPSLSISAFWVMVILFLTPLIDSFSLPEYQAVYLWMVFVSLCFLLSVILYIHPCFSSSLGPCLSVCLSV